MVFAAIAVASGIGTPRTAHGSGGPVISEFMASNGGGLYDEDGDTSDWIEILNPGPSAIDLGGLYLTDDAADLTKWRLPSMQLPPGGFQIIFASGKNRDGGEPHANFKLASQPGGYLALVDADGTSVLSSFASYPQQFEGFSYGLLINGSSASTTVLVREGDACKVLVPTNDLGLGWTQRGFDDSAWLDATTAIGFERGSGYENLFGPGGDILSLASNINASAYCRIPFTMDSIEGLSTLRLRVKADDGFVAYLNGVRVASLNAPPTPEWNSSATSDRPDDQALEFADTDLTSLAGALTPGLNVLAIHALNSSPGSSDMLLLPRLEAESAAGNGVTLGDAGYFQSPTPGGAPIGEQGLPAPDVMVSEPGRGFVNSLQVSLTTSSATAQIRYTLDGSVPTANSLLYQGAPLAISATTLLRARCFDPPLTPGRLTEEAYIRLSANMQTFSSDLPVIVMNRIGAGSTAANGKTYAFFAFFEPDPTTGRTTLNRPYALGTRGGWKVRGSSSAGFPKQAFSVEAWDVNNRNKAIAPLGMPEESDWVFHAQSVFDRSLMRNSYIYALSNQIGRYAVRTKFCELFKDDNAGDLNYATDYWGVYDCMEKISRDKNRVDVERLPPGATTEPAITGGYMLKVDRLDPGDSGLNAGGQSLGWVYPKEEDTTPAQVNYVRTFLNDMVASLGTDQRRRYIDELSWIDHHLLNVLTVNADALRLSTYFFKRRGQPLEFGPIWDFDRSAGSTDGRDANPSSWQGGTAYFDYPWWGTLFDDEDFWQLYIDRYFELRGGAFSTANVHALIDGMAADLMEAQVRNFQRWSDQPRFGGYQGEVNHLKNFLGTRLSWMDGQFVGRPTANLATGVHPAGTTLQLSAPLRAGQKIYYTLDGTDPRPPFVQPTIVGTALVDESTSVRALAPTSDISVNWRSDLQFDDSSWLGGLNGVGYERSSGYEPYIKVNMNTAMQSTASCYVRVKFNVDAAEMANWNFLTLAARYDDGFVAYLNGFQVLSDRAPAGLAWNSSATQTHDDGSAVNYQAFDLTAHRHRLRAGENLLAIHALNESLTSSDFLFQVRLVGGRRETPPGSEIRGQEYTGPVVLDQSARLVARVFDSTGGNDPYSGRTPVGTGWSAPWRAEYLINESPAAAGSLVISELFADPYEFAEVPDRQVYEWIEVQNISAQTISLTDVAITQGVEFQFPGVSLPPGGRAVVAKSPEGYARLYGDSRAAQALGPYSGSLDNAGESVTLTAADGTLIQSVIYPDTQTSRGHSLVATVGGWRASRHLLGSPGGPDPGLESPWTVVVNEIMANPLPPEVARIEIHNGADEAIDLTGWFLTDDLGTPDKHPLPDGTVIQAGGYVTFTASDMPGWPTSVQRGEMYLVAGMPDGTRVDYIDGFRFDYTRAGLSFGRHVLSTGVVHQVPLSGPSFGEANLEPLAGPLVISELMYHPPDGQAEYLELQNRGDSGVPLARVSITGTGYVFGAEAPVLPPGGLALVVGADPEAFRQAHSVPAAIPIFGPIPSGLSNAGERLRVWLPDDSQQGTGALMTAVETVEYSDDPPWPASADGQGHSLHRAMAGYGGEPTNWLAGPASPGSIDVAPPQDWRSQFFTEAELADPLISGSFADADGDGLPNLLEYRLGSHPRQASSMAAIDCFQAPESTVEITYLSREEAASIPVQLQESSDLVDWRPATGFTLSSTTSIGQGLSKVTLAGPAPAIGGFFRLSVAEPEVGDAGAGN